MTLPRHADSITGGRTHAKNRHVCATRERTHGMKNMPWLPARSVRPYMGQGEHSNSGAAALALNPRALALRPVFPSPLPGKRIESDQQL